MASLEDLLTPAPRRGRGMASVDDVVVESTAALKQINPRATMRGTDVDLAPDPPLPSTPILEAFDRRRQLRAGSLPRPSPADQPFTPEELEVIASAPPTLDRARTPAPPPAPPDAPFTLGETALRAPATVPRELAKGFATGTLGAAGTAVGAFTTHTYGDATGLEAARGNLAALAPETQGDPFEDPRVLADPNWWASFPAHTLGQILGTSAALAGTGATGFTVGGAAGRYLAVRPAVLRTMQRFGGSASAALGESLLEGAFTYEEAISRGMSQDEAARKAAGVASANLPLLMASNVPLFAGGGRGVQWLTQAVSEGIQEGSQEAIANVAMGDPWQEGVGLGAVSGAVGGPMAGAAIHRLTGQHAAERQAREQAEQERARARMAEEFQARRDQWARNAHDEQIRAGLAEGAAAPTGVDLDRLFGGEAPAGPPVVSKVHTADTAVRPSSDQTAPSPDVAAPPGLGMASVEDLAEPPAPAGRAPADAALVPPEIAQEPPPAVVAPTPAQPPVTPTKSWRDMTREEQIAETIRRAEARRPPPEAPPVDRNLDRFEAPPVDRNLDRFEAPTSAGQTQVTNTVPNPVTSPTAEEQPRARRPRRKVTPTLKPSWIYHGKNEAGEPIWSDPDVPHNESQRWFVWDGEQMIEREFDQRYDSRWIVAPPRMQAISTATPPPRQKPAAPPVAPPEAPSVEPPVSATPPRTRYPTFEALTDAMRALDLPIPEPTTDYGREVLLTVANAVDPTATTEGGIPLSLDAVVNARSLADMWEPTALLGYLLEGKPLWGDRGRSSTPPLAPDYVAWKRRQAAPPVTPPVDVNEFGEAQARLPGAGQVRDQDIATPQFEAPFTLDAGRVERSEPTDQGLFGEAPDETQAIYEAAVREGYRGPKDALIVAYQELESRAEYMRDWESQEHGAAYSPQDLMRAIAQAGGIGRDKGFSGQIDWLWQASPGFIVGGTNKTAGQTKIDTKTGRATTRSYTRRGRRMPRGSLAGVANVLRNDGTGLPLDTIRELLSQDARFAEITEDPQSLWKALVEAVSPPSKRGQRSLGTFRPTGAWWTDVITDEGVDVNAPAWVHEHEALSDLFDEPGARDEGEAPPSAPTAGPPVTTKSDALAAREAEIKAQLDAKFRELGALLNKTTMGVDPTAVGVVVDIVNLYAQLGVTKLEHAWERFKTDWSTFRAQQAHLPPAANLRDYFEVAFEMANEPALDAPPVTAQTEGKERGDDSAEDRHRPLDGALPGAREGTTGDKPARGDRAGDSPATGRGTGVVDAGRADVPTGPRRGEPRLARPGKRQSGRAAGPGAVSDVVDFRVAAQDDLGSGGPATRFDANLEAIRLVKELDAAGRRATAQEQVALAKYVGWGDTRLQPFLQASTDPATQRRYQALRDLVTEDEYEAIRTSTLNAHFTSADVYRDLWTALAHLGFERGKILEPALGIGTALGTQPEKAYRASQWVGVELDPLTSRIAAHLYQSATVRTTGFQDAGLPVGYFDLAVSNVPFSREVAVMDKHAADPQFPKSLPLHDYFFAKALEVVRPGGLVVFITSRFTLDKRDSRLRNYLATRARFLGAVRLASDTFLENAGTKVVTDVIVLQRVSEGVEPNPDAWTDTVPREVRRDGMTWGSSEEINRWYHDHPEAVLGRETRLKSGGLYNEWEYTVVADGAAHPVGAALKTLLPKKVYEPATTRATTFEGEMSRVPAPDDVRPGEVVERDGTFFVRDLHTTTLEPVDFPKARHAQVRAILALRAAAWDVLRTQQREDATDAQITATQKTLRAKWDTYVKRYGFLNRPASKRSTTPALVSWWPEDDPDIPFLLALEKWDAEKGTAEPADIFTQRVQDAYRVPDHAESPAHALALSLAGRGRLDPDYVAELLGRPVDEAMQALHEAGLAYQVPETDAWMTAAEYLSGPVRARLKQARAAAKLHPRFEANVRALEAAQPVEVGADRIKLRWAASWLPVDVMQDAIRHFTGNNAITHVSAVYETTTGQWLVPHIPFVSSSAQDKWGTSRVSVDRLIAAALAQQPVVVWDQLPDDSRVVNQQETAVANRKLEELQQAFQDWVWGLPAERVSALVERYNDLMNNLAVAEVDGSHLTFPGMSPVYRDQMAPHQRNAVWRFLSTGNVMLAHVVGAGKTWTFVASVMEARRLGLARRPLIVMPKHLVGSTAQRFLEMYPAAKILVPGKDDFTPQRRKRFLARIATGSWDAVLLSEEQLAKLRHRPATYAAWQRGETHGLRALMEDVRRQEGKSSATVKQLMKIEQALASRMKKLADAATRNQDAGNLTWEDLGIDMLVVDEAHHFKNLWFQTRQTRVKGIPNSDTARAIDLFLKVRHVRQTTKGRNILLATGTPVVNTLAEVFVWQRFLQPETLVDMGIGSFDAWAANFGAVVPGWERPVDGGPLRNVSRFAKFRNLPQLQLLVRQVTDVKTRDDLKLPTPPLKGGKAQPVVSPRHPLVKRMMLWLTERGKAARQQKPGTPGADNMLLISTDGRKGSLDLRLLRGQTSSGPQWESYLSQSKLAKAAEEIAARHRQWAAHRGAQVVFLDQGVPGGANVNLYDDLKRRLVSVGIPADEVAYVQDAKTDAAKLALFQKVREGRVRVLIGSTKTMGTGMNVQARLVALHHLDAPYVPADLEQREGRILRQGNLLLDKVPGFEVEILAYVQEGSIDETDWQRLARKQAFITDFMRGDLTVDEAEDLDIAVLSQQEIAAIASGDPRVLQWAQLDKERSELRAMESEWRTKRRQSLTSRALLQQQIASIERDRAQVVVLPPDVPVTVGATDYAADDRLAAGEALERAAGKVTSIENVVGKIGPYLLMFDYESHVRDQQTAMQATLFGGTTEPPPWRFLLKRNQRLVAWFAFRSAAGFPQSLSSLMQRLASSPGVLQKELERIQADLDTLTKQIEGEKAFPLADRLTEITTEYDRLTAELGKDTATQAAEGELGAGATDAPIVGNDSAPGPDALPVTMRTDLDRIQRPALPVATKSPAPAPSAVRPSALAQQLVDALTAMGKGRVPVSRGGFTQRAWGLFFSDRFSIRLEVSGDLMTLFHEAGHALDALADQFSNVHQKGPVADDLVALGATTSNPSYPKAQRRREGVAELVRWWLTQPDFLQQTAPDALAAWEAWLEGYPKAWEALRQVQANVQQYLGLNLGDRGALKIDWDAKRPGEMGFIERALADPAWASGRAQFMWTDRLVGLRQAVEDIAAGRPVEPHRNAYVLARLASGAASKAEAYIFRTGPQDARGQFITGPLSRTLQPVRHELQDFGTYLVMLRALELNKRQLETGISSAQARDWIARYFDTRSAEDRQRWQDTAKAVYAWQDAMLRYAEDRGVFSAAQTAQIRALNENYVPFQRVMEAVEGTRGGGGVASNFADRRVPIFRLKGSGRDIINPFESMVANAFTLVDMVEKNLALATLADMIDSTPGQPTAQWMERVTKIDAQRVNVDRVLEALGRQSTTMLTDDVVSNVRATLHEAGVTDIPGLITLFSTGVTPNKAQREITLIRDGKPEVWRVHSQTLYDSIATLGPQPTSVVAQVGLAAVELLRAGVTLAPAFVRRNFLRDQLVALFQSRHGFLPVYDSLRGLFVLLKGGEDAQRFWASGVAQASLAGADRSRTAARAGVERIAGRGLKYFALHPKHVLQLLSEYSEVATRAGEFLLVKEAGGRERRAGVLGLLQRATDRRPKNHAWTPGLETQAALAARDVTVDFGRGGKFTKEASQFLAFFNARAQGYVRIAETVQRDPAGVLLTLGALALLSLVTWKHNTDEDDEWTDKIPAHDRVNYWHIRLPNGGYARLPKPFEWAVPSNLLEGLLDYWHTENPVGLKQALRQLPVPTNLNDLVAGTTATFLVGAYEAASNYDSWRERNIVSPWDTSLDPELQYNVWTSDSAKLVGKWLKYSPAKLDHLFYSYTGTLGREVVEKGTDPLVRLVTGRERPAPARGWREPEYVSGDVGSDADSLVRFYELYQQMQTAKASVRRLEREEAPEEARARVQRARQEPWYPHRERLEATHKEFRDALKVLDHVYRRTDMTPHEKRQAIARTRQRMARLARAAIRTKRQR